MTSLDAKDMISGVDYRLTRLPDALTQAGIAVPSALTDGLAKARWTLPAPDLNSAEMAVMRAKSEKEFHAALVDLANGRLVADVMKTHAMRTVAGRVRLGAAEDGFRKSYPELMEDTIREYNAKIPMFRDQLTRLPDLQGRTAYDLSAEDAEALMAARQTASALTDLLGVYQDLAALSGWPGTGSSKDVPGAMALLSCIAVFRYGYDLEAAATDLVRYRHGEGQHAPLAPHATAVWHADHVELVDPDDAAERLAIARLNWSESGGDDR